MPADPGTETRLGLQVVPTQPGNPALRALSPSAVTLPALPVPPSCSGEDKLGQAPSREVTGLPSGRFAELGIIHLVFWCLVSPQQTTAGENEGRGRWDLRRTPPLPDLPAAREGSELAGPRVGWGGWAQGGQGAE